MQMEEHIQVEKIIEYPHCNVLIISRDSCQDAEGTQHCVITGQWANGKRNGHGVYTYFNGDKYSGGWVNDVKQGKGVYLYKKSESQVTTIPAPVPVWLKRC